MSRCVVITKKGTQCKHEGRMKSPEGPMCYPHYRDRYPLIPSPLDLNTPQEACHDKDD